MAIDVETTDVLSGYNLGAINENFEAIETALEKAVNRDGGADNEMNADLDMDSNDILNVNNISVNSLRIDGNPITASGSSLTTAQTVALGYNDRNLTNAQEAASTVNGTIFSMDGILYEVNSGYTSTYSCTNDLGVDGIRPFGEWQPQHFGTLDGTDDSAVFQRMFNAAPDAGVSIFIPRGTYTFNTTVHKKLNAGGANGWGWNIRGEGDTNTNIIHATGANDPTIYLEGPTGTFTSGVNVHGFRIAANTSGQGIGFRATGMARSSINLTYSNRLYRGFQGESVLICNIGHRGNSNVGVEYLKSGTLGGDWGVSGCNENYTHGDFGQCAQWGLTYDECRPGTLNAHIERCGNEDIAGGGVSDTDRGGIKLTNPQGALRWTGSSEDNGDLEGVNDGKGTVYVITDGTTTEDWSVVFNGVTIHGTLDRPTSYITVFNSASAGYGRLVFNGGSFVDGATYTPSASRPYLNLTANGRNLGVVMNGVSMSHGDVEFRDLLSRDVDYTLTNMPESTPDGAHSFVKTAEPNQPLQKLFSDGDFVNSGESLFGSRMSANGSVVYKHSYFGENSAGEQVTYCKFGGVLEDNTDGSEVGGGFNIEILNGSGGFDTVWKLGRAGIASFGETQMGSETINVGDGYYVQGLKVAGARDTGWTAGVGTPLKGSFDAATATLNEVARRVLALEEAARSGGSID